MATHGPLVATGCLLALVSLLGGCGEGDPCDTADAARGVFVAPADRQASTTATDYHSFTRVQAAIDSLAEEKGLGVVCVGRGTYPERVTIPGGVAVRAARGADVVFRAPDAFAPAVVMLGSLPGSVAELREVTVEAEGVAVQVQGNALLASLTITEAGKAVEVEAGARAEISGGIFRSITQAATVEGREGAKLEILGTDFHGNGVDVALLEGGNLVLDGTSHRITSAGDLIPIQVQYSTVSLNRLWMSADADRPAFASFLASDVEIDRAEFRSPSGAVPALVFDDQAAPASTLLATNVLVFSGGEGGSAEAAIRLGADTAAWLRFCALVSRDGGFSQGIEVVGGGSSLQITSSVVWGNGEFLEDSSGSALVMVDHSLLQGGFVGEGNLDTDPLFVSLSRGELLPTTTSPLVDAAITVPGVDTDLQGDPRLVGSAPDIGPYEVQVGSD